LVPSPGTRTGFGGRPLPGSAHPGDRVRRGGRRRRTAPDSTSAAAPAEPTVRTTANARQGRETSSKP